MAQSQQFCLRWNNHRTNLVSVFDELLQNEAFTDVTLACDGGSLKAHRMVLAACSPYFQYLFTDLPCKHPVVVLKDVKYSEIKAILEYMYRGEVNVAQDQLAALLKVAEALKVKGLVEENRACKTEVEDSPPLDHSPSISTSNQVHCSSTNSSPSHHSNSSLYKNPYSPCNDRKSMEARINLPGMWALPTLPLPPHTAAGPTQSHPHPAIAMHSAAYEAASSDMSMKRKKLNNMMQMQRDTPILRTVLGQGQVDSTQPVSLVCHPDSAEMPERDERIKQLMKNEPSEDAQSPYADFTERLTDEEEKSKLAIPSSSPQSFNHDMRAGGIATYVPSQKPEWKRYKQYTRNDIMSAIEAVKNGMSALQAARKYGVPSRTLYDKVKKMGISTNRPFKRSNGNSASFPYSSGSPYGSHLSENEEIINNNSSLMESSAFLQRVLDSRGGEEQQEALTAMAAVAAARAMHTMPMARQYGRLTPSPITHNGDQTNGSSEREREDDEDQVEDLSVHRKHEPMEVESRVIMPPMMNQISAIMKMKEMDGIKEDVRRELRVVEGGAD